MQKNIYQKLAEAREYIRTKAPKKDGENSFSNFTYFTPEYVEQVTSEACAQVGCVVLCDLLADELGLYQRLRFIDVEIPERFIESLMRTRQGEITSTNQAQQMGGTDTYSERYIKMKFFCIKDNTLDPDAHIGKEKVRERQTKNSSDVVHTWFSPKNEKHMLQLQSYRDDGKSNDEIIQIMRKTPGFGISKANAEKILKNEI